EAGAPAKRIIHARTVQLQGRAVLKQLGVRLGQGYQKCGGQKELDWAQNVSVLVLDERSGKWNGVFERVDIPEPVGTTWFDLPDVEVVAVTVVVRKSGVDRWWPSWNCAMYSVALEADYRPPAPAAPARNTYDLDMTEGTLPAGVSMALRGGEARYRTPLLEAGFLLRGPAVAHLGIDESGGGRTGTNQLKLASQHSRADAFTAYRVQGPRLAPCYPAVAGFYQHELEGITVVKGNRVRYWFKSREIPLECSVEWEVHERRVVATFRVEAGQPIRMPDASAWQLSFDSTASPLAALGTTVRAGETGLLSFPCILHLPGKGSLFCSIERGACTGRFDSIRPVMLNTFEFKVGAEPQPEGDYVLLAGTHEARVALEVVTPEFASLRQDAPIAAREMVRLRAVTALVYRADTDTFSNNGNSMHCPACLDSWADNAVTFVPFKGIDPMAFLQHSLERWLVEAPGYGSGRSIIDDEHRYEDEYLICGTAALYGLAKFLGRRDDPVWLSGFKGAILAQIDRMRRRDVDGDGLVESTCRLGISGQHQWSTNWWDVISFGWKDAFSNAFLYPALLGLAKAFRRNDMNGQADELESWAAKLKHNYVPTFLNEKTGWLAGWRCKEGRLHDYAFLAVNGAAVAFGLVEQPLARSMMEKLWSELHASRFKEFALGLPGNLWYIPDSDTASAQHGEPLGTYENGGATHSQARHFVSGLYKAGMVEEGDALLEKLAEGMADGSAFGGVGSGVDWRTWEGRPCGYEGILCDQFGIIVPAMDRWFKENHPADDRMP
ncbi:MAG: hypothetical protein JW839_06165, partial [Candidatus Lokiarchaeota archaeon]|nr:hypothetical protein [Candidatus Lokiarchaeota archaeon]